MNSFFVLQLFSTLSLNFVTLTKIDGSTEKAMEMQ